MAITLNTHTAYKDGWSAVGHSSAVHLTEVVQAAPGAGLNLHLERFDLTVHNTVDARSFTLGSGESGDAIETTMLGPFYFAADQDHTLSWKFARPLILAANKSLTIDSNAARRCTIAAQGATR